MEKGVLFVRCAGCTKYVPVSDFDGWQKLSKPTLVQDFSWHGDTVLFSRKGELFVVNDLSMGSYAPVASSVGRYQAGESAAAFTSVNPKDPSNNALSLQVDPTRKGKMFGVATNIDDFQLDSGLLAYRQKGMLFVAADLKNPSTSGYVPLGREVQSFKVSQGVVTFTESMGYPGLYVVRGAALGKPAAIFVAADLPKKLQVGKDLSAKRYLAFQSLDRLFLVENIEGSSNIFEPTRVREIGFSSVLDFEVSGDAVMFSSLKGGLWMRRVADLGPDTLVSQDKVVQFNAGGGVFAFISAGSRALSLVSSSNQSFWDSKTPVLKPWVIDKGVDEVVVGGDGSVVYLRAGVSYLWSPSSQNFNKPQFLAKGIQRLSVVNGEIHMDRGTGSWIPLEAVLCEAALTTDFKNRSQY